MASATDIITYIGIPLAVLGVLPILWNAIQSLRIRRHLERVIPCEARKHVSLIVDPVTAVVIAALPIMQLRWRNLFKISLLAKPLGYVDPSLEGCSWMSLVKAGVELQPARSGSQRLIVDSSLRFEARGCRCDRETFVFLALGMCVDPHHNRLDDVLALKDGVWSLYDMWGREVMTLDQGSSRILYVKLCGGLYSSRQSMAWFGVMAVRDNTGNGVSFQSIVPSDHSAIGKRDSPPKVEAIIRCFNELLDNMSLALALRWACYVESVFYDETEKEDILPVPQEVLKMCENAIVDLKRLDDMTLRTQIELICNNDGELKKAIQSALSKTEVGKKPPSSLVTHFADSQDSCINMRRFFDKSNILAELYAKVSPSFVRSWQHWQEDVRFINLDTTAVAAKIWLALSVIQLVPCSNWKSELTFNGELESKPDNTILRKLLEDSDTSPYLKIYIS